MVEFICNQKRADSERRFFMKRKVCSIILAAAMSMTLLAGCGGDKGNDQKGAEGDNKTKTTSSYAKDASIKVWGSQEDQDLIQDIIANFKKDNPEAADWTIESSVVSSADAKKEIQKDPTAAADVFEYASDQLVELVQSGVLYRITKNKDQIIAANDPNSIEAGTVDGELYGYPSTSNSFFMYYDKSKYTEDEVKNLNTMLEKDLDKGVTNFSMDLDNGWYTSAFFFGAGCKLFGDDGTDSKKCDFNNAQGVLVGDYILDLVSNKKVKNHDDSMLLAGFREGSLGASLTGTWNSAAIKEYLGDNFGVTTVPTITLEDGQEINPSTIVNYNLMGVNAQTKYPAEAMLFAEYMANEQSQKMRFEQRNASPTNLTLMADTELLSSSPAVAVLSKQVKTSTIQPSILEMENFWTPMEAFGQDCIAKEVTKANMQKKLDDMVKSITTKIGE